LEILSSGNLNYDPSIWLKVTLLSFTASNRKSAKNLEINEFLMIHLMLREQDRPV
jgi:hypothetical protein